MTTTEAENNRKLEEIHALSDSVRMLLRGQDSSAVGAVLADMLAEWIAQHISEAGPRPTRQLHRRLLNIHVNTVEKLIDYYRER